MTLPAQADNWSVFKQNYLSPVGRIMDKTNGISHSEGQGYSMLLAVYNDDPATFAELWLWTARTLFRPDIGLFSWRYDPSAGKVTDTNNASDGDTLIAWALLKAGQKWHNLDYIAASTNIQKAIIHNLVIPLGDDKILLPGVYGFSKDDGYIINPSYFIFPAWKSFYEQSHDPVWLALRKGALHILDKAHFGEAKLPADWLWVNNAGEVKPAQGWPTRFSYDAIRIPLYLSWSDPGASQLIAFQHFWARYDRNNTPAWINISGGEAAGYSLSGGGLAIRDLIMKDPKPAESSIIPDEGYYSSVLHLLALQAQKRQGSG
ncbi:endoglucanase [Pantoea sp. B65]